MPKCKMNAARLYCVIASTVRQHRINPDIAPMSKLLDALATDGPDNDDIITYLCEVMHSDVNVSRSTYINPFFAYTKIGIHVHNIPTVANGHNAIPGYRDKKRKPTTRLSKPVEKLQNKVDKLRRRQ